ncbi:1-deoxy-D-xylulose-5-phosphate synthase [Tateyamaria sp. 1078]
MDKLQLDEELPSQFRLSRSKIMYIESKADGLEGPAVIGRVYFSKSGKTLYYKGLKFQSLKGAGFKANYFETETGGHYWISGPRKDQNDRLYGGNSGVQIDDDVREEYATLISGRPVPQGFSALRYLRSPGC